MGLRKKPAKYIRNYIQIDLKARDRKNGDADIVVNIQHDKKLHNLKQKDTRNKTYSEILQNLYT